MARGQSGYGTETITISRRAPPRQSDEYDFEADDAVRKAQRFASHYNEDHAAMSTSSKRQDRALLNDITSRLYKLDFDRVKPCRDVQWQTGFRRKGRMYKDYPFLDKEFKRERRRDQLRYPWDYTTDNIYHKKPAGKPRQKTLADYVLQAQEEDAEYQQDNYPKYDPMGVYRPVPKRVHKPLPPADDKYKDMGIREMLTKLRIKSQLQPRGRSASADVDNLLEDLKRPLPKSGVSDYVPAMGADSYDYELEDYNKPQFDSLLKKKFEDSRRELDEFEEMLDRRFKKGKNTRVQSAAVILAAEEAAREQQRQRMLAASVEGMGLDDDDQFEFGYDRY